MYGRLVTVQTDHKPLESILKRPLMDAPRRLQRLLLRMQRYDFQLVYVAGSPLPIADALSRAPSANVLDESLVAQVVVDKDLERSCMIDGLSISDPTLCAMREKTAEDPVLGELIEVIRTGWPSNIGRVSSAVKPYFHM